MKKKNKIMISALCTITMVVCMMTGFISDVYAASASISASASTIYVGESVTFTVSVSNGAGYVTLSGAVNDKVWLDNSSQSYTVSGNSAGTLSVSIGGVVSDYDTEKDESVSGSASVSVINRPSNNGGSSNNTPSGGGNSNTGGATSGGTTSGGNTTPTAPTDTPEEEPKSTNNNLSGLSLSTGSLSPEFNADTTEYTVNLPADATTISIDASAADEKATVEGTGEHSLKAGTNEIAINVTAENGDVKTYYVKVNVDETPLVYTTFNNQKLGVVRNTDEIGIPNSFEETTVTLDGQEVKAWNSAQMNKTIVFLVNEAGEKNFYLFENNQITSIFKPVGLLGRNLYIVDVPADKQKMKGLIYGEVVIKDEKFNGWTFEDEAFSNYSIIYVMDELGNIKYYQYEKTEDALQLYSMAAPTTQEAVDKTNEKVNTQQMIIYALIATTLVGGGLAAYAFYQLVQSKKNSGYNKKFDYTNDDE